MVSHGEEEVPEEGELLLPGSLEDMVVEALDLVKGWVGRRGKSLRTEFVVDTVVDMIHPAREVLECGSDWVLTIVVCEGRTTELTGENVGKGLQEGHHDRLGRILVGKGDVMKESPS